MSKGLCKAVTKTKGVRCSKRAMVGGLCLQHFCIGKGMGWHDNFTGSAVKRRKSLGIEVVEGGV